jgi:hypothetical protein
MAQVETEQPSSPNCAYLGDSLPSIDSTPIAYGKKLPSGPQIPCRGDRAGADPVLRGSYILNNFIDIYRSYLAENFQTLIECNSNLIYESIQLSNATANGDLDIVLPKLRLPGTNPKELVGELMRKVC